MEAQTLPRRGAALRMAALIAVLVGLHLLAGIGLGQLDLDALPGPTVAVAIVLYALLLSLPCVPAVEIGLAMLAMYGAPLAVPLWAASVTGLTLAFCVGRFVPLDATVRLLVALRMPKAAVILRRMEPMTRAQRAEMLAEALPRWLPDAVIRHRYATLALLIALPGNIVMGGGGGLALLAGLSRLYGPAGFVAAAALATAPVPLAVLAWGWGP